MVGVVERGEIRGVCSGLGSSSFLSLHSRSRDRARGVVEGVVQYGDSGVLELASSLTESDTGSRLLPLPYSTGGRKIGSDISEGGVIGNV